MHPAGIDIPLRIRSSQATVTIEIITRYDVAGSSDLHDGMTNTGPIRQGNGKMCPVSGKSQLDPAAMLLLPYCTRLPPTKCISFSYFVFVRIDHLIKSGLLTLWWLTRKTETPEL